MANGKIVEFISRVFIRRKYKDFLFRRVFQDKEDVLSLYNALNGTNYDNASDLEITTLEDAIYMSMKNDLSFIISSTMNLYEHQSTVNPNMPVRGILYFARLYEAYISVNKLDVYGSKLIHFPKPQYVVFYNGEGDVPEEQFLRFSDSFYDDGEDNILEAEESSLECIVRVININYGHNMKILSACKKLHDYSYFINEIKKNMLLKMNREKAINQAIDDCIEKDILREILVKNKAEVMGMLLFTYDEKLHRKSERKIAREEGYAEGREEGIQSYITSCKELTSSKDITKQQLIKHYKLEDDEADRFIDKYWE